ncbi:hypothetical protein BGZ70_003847, partial [Mortierella alpina]
PQIRELKSNRRFTLICDGYDECQQVNNLYTSNQLNEAGQWRAKMIISCRSERIGQDYKDRFQPLPNAAAAHGAAIGQLQEAVIVPFSKDQIEAYIHRHVADVNPPWKAKSYITTLENIPNLMDLIKNPFLLKLSLDVLPGFVDVDKIQELSSADITRVGLYDRFVEHWLECGKKRVGNQDLGRRGRVAFDSLVDEGFTANGIDFLKRLAAAIYKEQAGHPVVEYSRFKDEETWKARFFSRKDENRLLRQACPLVRSGNQYRFIHKSLLEYCFARAVFDPQASSLPLSGPSVTRRGSVSSIFSFDGQTAPEECDLIARHVTPNSPLGWRSFVDEPSILQFLAERAQQEPSFKQQLLAMIEHSKTNKDGRIAAANAITLLVRAGMQFIGADLRGIRIPGANLSFGMFERAQLQGADMRKADFQNIWLRRADLSDSQMAGVRLGEWPYLQEDGKVWCLAYSPDGKSLAAGMADSSVIVYDAVTWNKLHTLQGHMYAVYAVAYSPDGHQIASGSRDGTVRTWDSQTGADILNIDDHTGTILAVVFSPSGHQIASGGCDNTVRLWDSQTGSTELTLTGHTDWVHSVVYSPNGLQIATASRDKTVRLWNALTGALGSTLTGHTGVVCSIAYSPSGQHIVSGSDDKTLQVWDTQTGSLRLTLTGHTSEVNSVAYSPSGHQIASGSGHQLASGSEDRTIRLWDAHTGAEGFVLTGHTDGVESVAYSPSGHQLASGDGTVRFWDVLSGGCLVSLNDADKSVGWLAWKDGDAGSHLAIGNDNSNTIRMWRVTEDEGKPCFSLQWSWPHGSLNIKDANLQGACGLNRMQIQLLKQRGIVGEPISPLSMSAVGGKLISMSGIVSQLNKPPKRELSDGLAEEPSAGDAEPEVALEGDELAIEE